MLAPLSALRMLEVLQYGHDLRGGAFPESALLAPLPALPDAPRLTFLILNVAGNYVPVGSDAALGRLRQLFFVHPAPVQGLLDAEDPFLLRAAFDAGTWRPSRLTGLQELECVFEPVSGLHAPSRPLRTGSRAGSEWASLAGQVTGLCVTIRSYGYRRPSTGIVAGLGALTALRDLRVFTERSGGVPAIHQGSLLEPVFIDRVRAPLLTRLECDCVTTPVSVARFPNLVHLDLVSTSWHLPPLNLRSLVSRSGLKIMKIGMRKLSSPSFINLAELFVGGRGWPALEELGFGNMVLEWDATGVADAPTAAEFAKRARELLPALVKVKIDERSGPGALPDRSRVKFVVACRRHVVPALKGLLGGGS